MTQLYNAHWDCNLKKRKPAKGNCSKRWAVQNFIVVYTVWNVWDEGGTMHEQCFKGTSNFTTNDCHINMTGERKET